MYLLIFFFSILILLIAAVFFIYLHYSLKVKKLEKTTKDLEENFLEKSQQCKQLQQDLAKGLDHERKKTLSIINNFTDGLLVLNGENKVALLNYKAEFFLEVIAERVKGRPFSEITDSLYFEKLKNFLKENKKSIFQKELFLREGLILEVSTLPITSDDGNEGTLVILHDVTRERMVEKTKSEFLSLAAHRLRTPLSAIKWTLRMFLEGDFGRLNKKQQGFMQKTYHSNERMINLVNDILEVIRMEEGKIVYKPSIIDPLSIIQPVMDNYQREAKKRKIKLIFKKPAEELPLILADVEKVKIAFQNLIDNAIKYNRSGGEVTVSLKAGIKEVGVSVKDTGVGILQNQQRWVFTKFFRGANVMRMETEGTGLGLFIARNIIEAHGGKIWFVSRENKGSTFIFTLPVKEKNQNSPNNNLALS